LHTPHCSKPKMNQLWARFVRVLGTLAGLYAMNPYASIDQPTLFNIDDYTSGDWTPLSKRIEFYYEVRKLTWPSFKEAMEWAMTEIAEVLELDLARGPKWVRNNPKDHPLFSESKLAEELGDAMLMLQVAGMVEGVDPLFSLYSKMNRKIEANLHERFRVLNKTPG